MLDAGVSIEKALTTFRQTAHGSMRHSFDVMTDCVRRGMPLSEGMKICGEKSFPRVDIDSVFICEKSGALEGGFKALADYHSRVASARDRIISASMYPLFLLVAGVFVCRLPDFILGVTGKAPYTIIHYLRDTFGFLICLALLCWFVFWIFKIGFRIPGINLKLDMFIRYIPVFGKFQMDYTLSRWVESIRLMLNAGYGVVQALEIATPLTASPMIVHAYEKARPLINNPMTVSEAFGSTGLFRPILIQMWATGEESGRIDDMLDSLAAHFADEWNRSLENLTAWIPRIVYGVIMFVLAIQIIKMAGVIAQNTASSLEQ